MPHTLADAPSGVRAQAAAAPVKALPRADLAQLLDGSPPATSAALPTSCIAAGAASQPGSLPAAEQPAASSGRGPSAPPPSNKETTATGAAREHAPEGHRISSATEPGEEAAGLGGHEAARRMQPAAAAGREVAAGREAAAADHQACMCPAGQYGYLKAAAAAAVSARAVLRHSYVAAYALQWGERRRWAPASIAAQVDHSGAAWHTIAHVLKARYCGVYARSGASELRVALSCCAGSFEDIQGRLEAAGFRFRFVCFSVVP